MISRENLSGIEIVSELLSLTRMMAKSEDPDFLVEAVDKRGELMDKYDSLKASGVESSQTIEKNKSQIKAMIKEIIELDKKVNNTLFTLFQESKSELKNSAKNNKILNYTNQAISSSGSYMDYKK